jgi:hypothetical protein
MTHIIYANISRQEYLEFLSEFEFGNIITGYVFQLVVYENSHAHLGPDTQLCHKAGCHAVQYLGYQKSIFSDDT